MEVEVLESSMVAPSELTPKHTLWLSNLDLQFPSTHYTPVVLLYRPSPRMASFSLDIMKAALSKALVPYYPLAGRLTVDGNTGRPEISCTGDGVLFVTARAGGTLGDLGDLAPSEELRRMLVPSAADGGGHAGVLLVMLQVTFFRCGAVCLGVATQHMASDGRGVSHFLNTWAAIARGGVDEAATLPRPFLDRSLLRERSPPAAVRIEHAKYPLPHSGGGGASSSKLNAPFATAILRVSKGQVEALKCSTSGGGGGGYARGKRASMFAAVAAHLWRCTCKVHGLLGTEETRLFVAVDIRTRVRPPLPDSYLGNALVHSLAVAKVEDVVSGPIGAVAAKVAEASAQVTDEHIRSQVEYMEKMEADPEKDLYVVSWGNLGFSGVDFGWGRPAFFRRATMRRGGLMYLVPCLEGEGGVDVVVTVEPAERVDRFKELFYEGLNGHSLTEAVKQSKI